MLQKKISLFFIVLVLFPITVFSADWEWQNPLPQGNSLFGVWGNSGSDVFAVGGATILHYNGSTWSVMTSGATKILYSLWGSSGSDVFAVGEGGTILHYNGSTWSSMTSGASVYLQSVWGSSGSDVFAAGYAGQIYHYNGSTWTKMTSGTIETLYSLWGSSGSDVFAVGNGGKILHYNGSIWSAMTSGTTMKFSCVWGRSGSDVFAVGYDSKILHYNGSTWSAMTNIHEGFFGIWGSSESDVFAVGDGGKIFYYDGSNWSAMTSGTGQNLDIVSVWGSSESDVFAVGYFNRKIILHYNGSTWSEMTNAPTNYLYGLWGSSGSDVFAVGHSGNIFHYNGSTWSAMTSGTTCDLYGVWGSSGSDVFAVGACGKILHYNGSIWSIMTSGTTMQLSGVWGSSGSDVFAVGEGGTILHYNGSTWSAMTSGTEVYLCNVWGSSESDVFAVGEGGKILHYKNNIWISMSNPYYGTNKMFNGVWGSSGSDVFAVGNGGTILHYDGSIWSDMPSGTVNYLKSIWGSSWRHIFAVGYNTILHCGRETLITTTSTTVPSTFLSLYPAADGHTDHYLEEWYMYGAGLIDAYETLTTTSGIKLSNTGGGQGNIVGYVQWSDTCTGVLEFDLSGLRGLINQGRLKADLTLTLKNYNALYDPCLKIYDILDEYENGVVEGLDITSSSIVDELCPDLTVGEAVTFDVTAAVGHDFFGSDQSDFTGFYIKNTDTLFEFYDHTDPLYAPLLRIWEEPTTSIRLGAFTAVPGRQTIFISWKTETEIESAGFNLLRSETEKGEYVKINTSLIPAQGLSIQGTSYAFVDRDVENRKIYYYKLEDIDLNGTSTMHGPVSATPRFIFGIFKK
jgi:hypothetical protein